MSRKTLLDVIDGQGARVHVSLPRLGLDVSEGCVHPCVCTTGGFVLHEEPGRIQRQ